MNADEAGRRLALLFDMDAADWADVGGGADFGCVGDVIVLGFGTDLGRLEGALGEREDFRALTYAQTVSAADLLLNPDSDDAGHGMSVPRVQGAAKHLCASADPRLTRR